MQINDITNLIIRRAVSIHRELGPGLLESVYEKILVHGLRKDGMQIESQVEVPVVYEDVSVDVGFRLDVLVERLVIVEIKSIEKLARVHYKQLLTYLRLSHLPVGLLINFNEELLVNGIKRVVNNYEETR